MIRNIFMVTFFILPIVLISVLFSDKNREISANLDNDLFKHFNKDWMKNSYWFQGKAEINFYKSIIYRYGAPRKTNDVVHILVAEKHYPRLLVKADNWKESGLLDMLKFNYVINYQTGIYNYHQMMSVFFDQKNLKPVKMTFTSQEWCGTSFKEIINFRKQRSYLYNTYWDNQGNGKFEVNFPENLVFYDALPINLRAINFQSGLTMKLNLLPSQISSKAQKPEINIATIELLILEKILVAAGEFESFKINLNHNEGIDSFWFEANFPNRLLLWKTYNGNIYELYESKFLPYWELNKPGDEKYLPKENQLSVEK